MATTTVTGQYLHPNGDPCSGRVSFRLVETVYHTGLDAIFPEVSSNAALDSGGNFTIELEPTSGDDLQFDSTTLTYEVTERIAGRRPNRDAYWVDVPTAPAVDLGVLTTYDDPPGSSRVLVEVSPDDVGYLPREELGITVSAYGATGDGVTDDGAAVQAAVTAAAGGRVYFTPGLTYLVRNIAVSSNTTIDLNGATVQFGGAHGTAPDLEDVASVFHSVGSEGDRLADVTITGGTILGDRTGSDFAAISATEQDALQFWHVDGVRVEGVNFRDVRQDGCTLAEVDNFVITGCIFTDFGDAAVDCRSNVNGGTISNNRVDRCRNLINAKVDLTDTVITGNTVTSFEHAVYVHGRRITVTDNVASATTTPDAQDGADYDGVRLARAPTITADIDEISDVVVANNTITGYAQGVNASDSDGQTVTNILVTGNTLECEDGGVLIEGEGSAAGNKIRGTGTYGISITAAGTVTGNTLEGCTAAASLINVGGTTGSTITNNRIVDGAGAGIVVTSDFAVITGNEIDVTSVGVYGVGYNDLKIADNRVTTTGGHGIHVSTSDQTITGNRVNVAAAGGGGIVCAATDSTIVGNRVTLTGSGQPGINVTGARCTVTGNSAYGTTSTGQGIYLGAADCVASGNVTQGNNHGIRIDASNCVASGNRCRDASFNGIQVMATSTKSLVVGNVLLNNTTALTDSGTTTTSADNITA